MPPRTASLLRVAVSLACLSAWGDSAAGVTVAPLEDREAAARNQQVGLVTLHAEYNSGTSVWPKMFGTLPSWAASSEGVEVVQLDWAQVRPTPTTFGVPLVERTLANLAARGRQAVLRIVSHGWRDANATANRQMPAHMYAAGFPLALCQDGSRRGRFWVPDWDGEELLVEVEATAAALGAAFNGDTRLFATEVGFVGYDAGWMHGHNALEACPLPSAASTTRIVTAMAKAFSESWVLMPRPWAVAEVDYASHPNLGVVDTALGSGEAARGLPEVGLEERWRTAPVLGLVQPAVERCAYVPGNATDACAAAGVGVAVPSVAAAAAASGATLVQHVDLFAGKADADAAAAVHMRVGAVLHLASLSLHVSKADGVLRACAVVSNIGTAPFHAPPTHPLTLRLALAGGPSVELANTETPVPQLMPGDTAVYTAAPVPWGDQDECTTRGTVCAAATQSCRDPEVSAASRGDWECVCGGGAVAERGRPAVCLPVALQRDAVADYGPAEGDVVGTSKEYGMVSASYTVSLKVWLRTCTKTGCGTASVAHVWDNLALVGCVEEWRGFFLRYQGRGLYVSSLTYTCQWKNAAVPFPTNRWVHVVAAYDKGTKTMRLYVDGTLVKSCGGWAPIVWDRRLAVGKEVDRANPVNTAGINKLKGRTRELRILKGVATAADVERLRAEPAPLQTPSTGGVAAVLRLDTTFRVRPLLFASAADAAGVAAFATDGAVTVAVPEADDDPAGLGGCLAPTPAPPTLAPLVTPFDSDGCALGRLEGHGHEAQSGVAATGTADALCDGVYEKTARVTAAAGTVLFWRKVAELGGGSVDLAPRELWPRGDGGFTCVFGDTDEDGTLAVGANHTVEWWQQHMVCDGTVAPGSNISSVTEAPAVPVVAAHTWSPTAVPTPVPPTTAPLAASTSPATDTPVQAAVQAPVVAAPLVVAFTGSPYTPIPEVTEAPTLAPNDTAIFEPSCGPSVIETGSTAASVSYELGTVSGEDAVQFTVSWSGEYGAIGLRGAGLTGMSGLDTYAFNDAGDVVDGNVDTFAQPSADTEQNAVLVSHVGSQVVFYRLLQTTDPSDFTVVPGVEMGMTWATGSGIVEDGSWQYHSARGKLDVVLGCNATDTPPTVSPPTMAPLTVAPPTVSPLPTEVPTAAPETSGPAAPFEPLCGPSVIETGSTAVSVSYELGTVSGEDAVQFTVSWSGEYGAIGLRGAGLTGMSGLDTYAFNDAGDVVDGNVDTFAQPSADTEQNAVLVSHVGSQVVFYRLLQTTDPSDFTVVPGVEMGMTWATGSGIVEDGSWQYHSARGKLDIVLECSGTDTPPTVSPPTVAPLTMVPPTVSPLPTEVPTATPETSGPAAPFEPLCGPSVIETGSTAVSVSYELGTVSGEDAVQFTVAWSGEYGAIGLRGAGLTGMSGLDTYAFNDAGAVVDGNVDTFAQPSADTEQNAVLVSHVGSQVVFYRLLQTTDPSDFTVVPGVEMGMTWATGSGIVEDGSWQYHSARGKLDIVLECSGTDTPPTVSPPSAAPVTTSPPTTAPSEAPTASPTDAPSAAVDECDASPCGAGQMCVDPYPVATVLLDFSCTCTVGTGTAVGEPAVCRIDECESVPCDAGQVCVDSDTAVLSLGDFTCTCANGVAATGAAAVCEKDECRESPCGLGQTCLDQNTSALSMADYACACADDPTLVGLGAPAVCSIDECVSSPCGGGHSCTDPDLDPKSTLDFVCACDSDPSIMKVGGPAVCSVDECALAPCGPDQQCNDPSLSPSSGDDFVCTCPNGVQATGAAAVCEVDECAGTPCGAEQTCEEGSTAANSRGDYVCRCDGDTSVTATGMPVAACTKDECVDVPCGTAQTCSDASTSPLSLGDFVCACTGGTLAEEVGGPAVCEAGPVDECASMPCGSQACTDPDQTASSDGDFICTCLAGTGTATGRPAPCKLDECESTPCGSGQHCSDASQDVASLGDFTCSCVSPRVGNATGVAAHCTFNECSQTPAPCGTQTCADLNTAEASLGDFQCECANGVAAAGALAVCDRDECAPQPCGADQLCDDPDTAANRIGDFTCVCEVGTGTATGMPAACRLDECAAAPCGSGQRCADASNAVTSLRDFECSCIAPFAGVAVGESADCTLNECGESPPPCGTMQTCHDADVKLANLGGFTCTCDNGVVATGAPAVCEKDECEALPCGTEQICHDPNTAAHSLGDFTCLCKIDPAIRGTGKPADCAPFLSTTVPTDAPTASSAPAAPFERLCGPSVVESTSSIGISYELGTVSGEDAVQFTVAWSGEYGAIGLRGAGLTGMSGLDTYAFNDAGAVIDGNVDTFAQPSADTEQNAVLVSHVGSQVVFYRLLKTTDPSDFTVVPGVEMGMTWATGSGIVEDGSWQYHSARGKFDVVLECGGTDTPPTVSPPFPTDAPSTTTGEPSAAPATSTPPTPAPPTSAPTATTAAPTTSAPTVASDAPTATPETSGPAALFEPSCGPSVIETGSTAVSVSYELGTVSGEDAVQFTVSWSGEYGAIGLRDAEMTGMSGLDTYAFDTAGTRVHDGHVSKYAQPSADTEQNAVLVSHVGSQVVFYRLLKTTDPSDFTVVPGGEMGMTWATGSGIVEDGSWQYHSARGMLDVVLGCGGTDTPSTVSPPSAAPTDAPTGEPSSSSAPNTTEAPSASPSTSAPANASDAPTATPETSVPAAPFEPLCGTSAIDTDSTAVSVSYELGTVSGEDAVQFTVSWSGEYGAIGLRGAGLTGMSGLDTYAFDTAGTRVHDGHVSKYAQPSADTEQNAVLVSHVGSQVVFYRLLKTTDPSDFTVVPGVEMGMTWATGSGIVEDGSWRYHSARGKLDVVLECGGSDTLNETAVPSLAQDVRRYTASEGVSFSWSLTEGEDGVYLEMQLVCDAEAWCAVGFVRDDGLVDAVSCSHERCADGYLLASTSPLTAPSADASQDVTTTGIESWERRSLSGMHVRRVRSYSFRRKLVTDDAAGDAALPIGERQRVLWLSGAAGNNTAAEAGWADIFIDWHDTDTPQTEEPGLDGQNDTYAPTTPAPGPSVNDSSGSGTGDNSTFDVNGAAEGEAETRLVLGAADWLLIVISAILLCMNIVIWVLVYRRRRRAKWAVTDGDLEDDVEDMRRAQEYNALLPGVPAGKAAQSSAKPRDNWERRRSSFAGAEVEEVDESDGDDGSGGDGETYNYGNVTASPLGPRVSDAFYALPESYAVTSPLSPVHALPGGQRPKVASPSLPGSPLRAAASSASPRRASHPVNRRSSLLPETYAASPRRHSAGNPLLGTMSAQSTLSPLSAVRAGGPGGGVPRARRASAGSPGGGSPSPRRQSTSSNVTF